MTIKGPYLILTNPDTLINTTANRLTRSHIRTEVSHLSGYNVNTGIINDPSLCHKIKNIKLELKNEWLISDFVVGEIRRKSGNPPSSYHFGIFTQKWQFFFNFS